MRGMEFFTAESQSRKARGGAQSRACVWELAFEGSAMAPIHPLGDTVTASHIVETPFLPPWRRRLIFHNEAFSVETRVIGEG